MTKPNFNMNDGGDTLAIVTPNSEFNLPGEMTEDLFTEHIGKEAFYVIELLTQLEESLNQVEPVGKHIQDNESNRANVISFNEIALNGNDADTEKIVDRMIGEVEKVLADIKQEEIGAPSNKAQEEEDSFLMYFEESKRDDPNETCEETEDDEIQFQDEDSSEVDEHVTRQGYFAEMELQIHHLQQSLIQKECLITDLKSEYEVLSIITQDKVRELAEKDESICNLNIQLSLAVSHLQEYDAVSSTLLSFIADIRAENDNLEMCDVLEKEQKIMEEKECSKIRTNERLDDLRAKTILNNFRLNELDNNGCGTIQSISKDKKMLSDALESNQTSIMIEEKVAIVDEMIQRVYVIKTSLAMNTEKSDTLLSVNEDSPMTYDVTNLHRCNHELEQEKEKNTFLQEELSEMKNQHNLLKDELDASRDELRNSQKHCDLMTRWLEETIKEKEVMIDLIKNRQ